MVVSSQILNRDVDASRLAPDTGHTGGDWRREEELGRNFAWRCTNNFSGVRQGTEDRRQKTGDRRQEKMFFLSFVVSQDRNKALHDPHTNK